MSWAINRNWPMLTVPLCSSRASDIILSSKMLKRAGEGRHLCLTGTVFFFFGYMDEFRFYVLFNSMSVISGQ